MKVVIVGGVAGGATELKDLDLAYAPPYSSAKDPVNMASFFDIRKESQSLFEGIDRDRYLSRFI